MGTFDDLVKELERDTKLQQTPIPYTQEDYGFLVVKGIRGLVVDIGDSAAYASFFDESTKEFKKELTLTEREYILLVAKFEFVSQIQAEVNTLYGYSTDSLSVTHADKPYTNLDREKSLLKNRLVEVFHKLRAERGA